MKQVTKNFNLIEFQSKDGSTMPSSVKDNVERVAKNLQVLREYIGKPIHINSAYRSPSHNRRVGGVLNSFHVKGMAVDIVVKGMTTRKLYRTIRKLQKQGKMEKGGLGLYNTFVHYDIRGYYARWDKSSWFNF